jgi:hypothetical protein
MPWEDYGKTQKPLPYSMPAAPPTAYTDATMPPSAVKALAEAEAQRPKKR